MLTPEQIAERRTGIGGSDMAAVLGCNPYRAPIDVWLDKLGLSEPFEGNEKTLWGDLLEPIIAQEYERRTGDRTAKADHVLRHPKHDWMLGNPDRVLVGKRKGLEVKTAGTRSLHRWGDPPEDCPEEYIIQCAAYMAVTDCDEWDLAALLGGQELRIYTIARDLDLEAMMIEEAGRFWHEHVLTGVQPDIDGSESFKNYLKERYPRDERPFRAATHQEIEWADSLREQLAEAEIVATAAELERNRLKASMQDVAGIFGDDWKITWKADKNGKRTFRAWF